MNTNSSLAEEYERGRSFDGFLVRSFRASDRQKVLSLHASATPVASVPCDCTANIDRIQEIYLRHPRNHFWVADAHGEILGTVGIGVQDEEVAHLHCLRAVDNPISNLVRKGLVQVAANHAHLHGCLKLILHAQVDVGRAAEFLHRLGFQFSRQREVDAQSVLEFYLNLYEQPELLAVNRATRIGATPGESSSGRMRGKAVADANAHHASASSARGRINATIRHVPAPFPDSVTQIEPPAT